MQKNYFLYGASSDIFCKVNLSKIVSKILIHINIQACKELYMQIVIYFFAEVILCHNCDGKWLSWTAALSFT